MPELPEVEVVRKQLKKLVLNKKRGLNLISPLKKGVLL